MYNLILQVSKLENTGLKQFIMNSANEVAMNIEKQSILVVACPVDSVPCFASCYTIKNIYMVHMERNC